MNEYGRALRRWRRLRGVKQSHAAELRGVSLWGFATDEIRSAEARLGDLGWYDDGAVQVSFWTGANDSPLVRIDPGILVWERLQLGDGTLARLVTSTPAG